jgi:hypothetical protein
MSTGETSEKTSEAPDPSGNQMLLALLALFSIVLITVGLVALTAWGALVFAVIVMAIGLAAVTRYVSVISGADSYGERGEEEGPSGLSGVVGGLVMATESLQPISRHDIRIGEPERLSAPASSEPGHSESAH